MGWVFQGSFEGSASSLPFGSLNEKRACISSQRMVVTGYWVDVTFLNKEQPVPELIYITCSWLRAVHLARALLEFKGGDSKLPYCCYEKFLTVISWNP